MSTGDFFRPYPVFNEREVFDATGRPETVRRLRPSNFEGSVANWANDRMRMYGETVVPKMVYVHTETKKPHRVAWVYHEGRNDEGEPFCMHHVACDCSGDIDRAETPEEKQAIVAECPALIPALDQQAALVNATYGIGDMFRGLNYDPETPMEDQGGFVRVLSMGTISYLLEHDFRHPESWVANVESGWTLTNLMARIIQIDPEDVRWLAEQLAEQELVETDGVQIRLSQNQMDLIEMDRRLDDILDGTGEIPQAQ